MWNKCWKNEIKCQLVWLQFKNRWNDEIKRIENKIIKDIVETSNVILSINSSTSLDIISDKKFDVVIINEQ